MGPFVDTFHPLIQAVPSVRDLISTHVVCPQCEFSRLVTKSDPRIQLVPNPCTFSINDMTFGATSVDVLFHLQKEKVLKRGQVVDSVVSLFPDDSGNHLPANDCRHLLQ
ncbi:hypothetical protein GGU11DRAFT_819121 [Lentinula aff. detonsa]|nr:hypothetical protein GGU11DRAFT_819121 [Lentinula aff. detonsa]